MPEILPLGDARELLTELRLLRREMGEHFASLDLRLRQLELAAAHDDGVEASRQHHRTRRDTAAMAGISALVSAAVSAIATWLQNHFGH